MIDILKTTRASRTFSSPECVHEGWPLAGLGVDPHVHRWDWVGPQAQAWRRTREWPQRSLTSSLTQAGDVLIKNGKQIVKGGNYSDIGAPCAARVSRQRSPTSGTATSSSLWTRSGVHWDRPSWCAGVDALLFRALTAAHRECAPRWLRTYTWPSAVATTRPRRLRCVISRKSLARRGRLG